MTLSTSANEQQINAITAAPGPTLVLAGPGTGKTRVLTGRIAYLINRMGVRPYHILAMTFSYNGARKMQNRVESMLEGQASGGLWLGTFHATCARILRREASKPGLLPIQNNFVIYDEDDQGTLIKRIVKELNLNDKLYRPNNVLGSISKAKNELIGPHAYPRTNLREETIWRIYQRYQDLLVTSNAVDFDDLMFYTVTLLNEHPLITEQYVRQFEHVLVDEFQDTNMVQYSILRSLAPKPDRSIFVVGDEDQSIYRWRGADYRNVLRFEHDYPKCTKILLEQNYRSTQTVLDAATAVISHNDNRTPKKLFSERGRGDKISLYEADDDRAEAAYVIDTIAGLVSSHRADPGDFAIMYRTNAQSRLLEEAFLHAGLPYRLVGAQRFYGRREVKDVLAYLRLVHNPSDEVSLMRVINVPPRGVGDKTLLTLQTRARQTGLTTGQVLLDLTHGPDSPHWEAFSGRSAAVLADFATLLKDWSSLKDIHSLPELFDHILEAIHFHDYIDDQSEEGQDRWENVQELRRIAGEYEERGLSDFLENLALVSDQDTLPETVNAPTLLTLHAAKGLEFTRVFITGLDEGLLPHSRSKDDPEQMAEERRLFYVGLTRAKDQLYLVRAERRGSFDGSYEAVIPSSFLEDLPEELVSNPRRAGRRAASRSGEDAWQSSSRPAPAPAQPQSKSSAWSMPQNRQAGGAPKAPTLRFSANMRIRHAVWGEGWVLESKWEFDDETVVIQFDSVGLKRLAASLANLEIVK